MNTFICFAGHLADEPELLHTHENDPFISCRVLVNRRTRNAAGEWADAEPTAHTVKIYGRAATHVYDSAGRGDRLTVMGFIKTEVWTDGETGTKRTKDVVIVNDTTGEVGLSLRNHAARIDRAPAAASA